MSLFTPVHVLMSHHVCKTKNVDEGIVLSLQFLFIPVFFFPVSVFVLFQVHDVRTIYGMC